MKLERIYEIMDEIDRKELQEQEDLKELEINRKLKENGWKQYRKGGKYETAKHMASFR